MKHMKDETKMKHIYIFKKNDNIKVNTVLGICHTTLSKKTPSKIIEDSQQ